MTILHICSSDGKGGAAASAWRLHRSLQECGADSRMLVYEKWSRDPSVASCANLNPTPPAELTRMQAIEHVYRDRNRTAIGNTYFSLPLLGLDLAAHPSVLDAGLIHLHWVSSFLTPQSIAALQRLGKPLVWTLHDTAAFTGGCHFPAGCEGFRSSCAACPQLQSDPFALPAAVLREKKAMWRADLLAAIAPSRWMAALARESSLFASGTPVTVIPNGVDTRVFRPIAKEEARSALGLPPKGRYLLCGADQPLELRKGFASLGRVLKRCLQDPQLVREPFRILWVGGGTAPWPAEDIPVHSLGRLGSENEMALAYSAADLYVLPSQEDNLPNMMLESFSCGTPVVAFAVGGVPDVIRDTVHGHLVPLGDEEAMAAAIVSALRQPKSLQAMGQAGRALMESEYSSRAIAERHMEFYRDLERGWVSREIAVPAPTGGIADGPGLEEIMPALSLHCAIEELMRLKQELEEAERDRAARLAVIEEMDAALTDRQAAIQALETELAARLQLLEEQEAHRKQRESDAARLVQALEEELAARLRLLEEQEQHRLQRESEFVEVVQSLQQELAARLNLLEEQEEHRQTREAEFAVLVQSLQDELAARLKLLEEQEQHRQRREAEFAVLVQSLRDELAARLKIIEEQAILLRPDAVAPDDLAT